jgi:Alpha amylase, catalytic domain/Ig-like domain CHU_C associated/Fibronectin type III domain/Carbohydrate-binding module 48 (Isoamylase N-terminal domain)
MKKVLLLLSLFLISVSSFSQRLLSWTPEFPNDNSTMTVTIDCTKGNQGLLNYANTSDVYVHVGVNTNLSTGPGNWRYVKFASFSTAYPAAQATYLGNNKYSYTITDIRTFFGVPAGETINKVNIIFRNGAGTLKQVNSDNSDMYIPVYAAGQFAVRLNLPPFEPRFVPYAEPINISLGNAVAITGVASNNAALTLKLNGTNVNTAASATTISANPTITVACEQKIMLEGNDGTGLKKDSFSFFIAPTNNIAALPAGAIEGINYLPGNTSATLVLYAPNKTSVNVIGDFNNWTSTCASQMNKTPDGNYYWITLTGLTPGTEYGFQYLVDNTIKIADPYTQKILDPDNDQYITSVTYPNLKPYPAGLTTGLVGILQTAEPQYTWLANSFVKPDKRNLMAYELLIRDFTAEHSYQSLIDSLNYLKGVGINAIELMPINEFDGNESWGYNPSYFFAPDKYYGTKNKLKEFIDKCHLNGIAVILDVVYNHCTGNAAQAKLYWNSATNNPAANNPWLNVTATHPYSVFNDFNHSSMATKYFVQRNLNFWIDEYRVDGFRFDLAKGFSQTITNTTTVENYDPARVANLKYYYDQVVPTHPNTYMILEFLGGTPSQEEQEYNAHGFMPWGNMNAKYNQCTMGFASNSDISAIVYNSSQRFFSNPGLIGYMESHDEERTMYKNLQFGNASGGYDTKVLNTALAREEAAASVFFTVPGPKMIWQFEERGYDVSLGFGGSNLANKPPRWEYMLDPNRRKLYDAYKKILDLRLNNPAVFNNTTFSYDFFNGGGLVKTFQIADPNAAGKKVTVVANLDVVQQTKSVTFQATGDWTNYLSTGAGTGVNGTTNSTFNITNATQNITLAAGEYHIYVSVPTCTTIAPTGTTTITYCQNATATALTATGTSLLWYTTATGGTGSTTAPTPSTATVGSTIYYVSQTLNSCEGPRLAITVTVNALPAAPTVTNPINYCQFEPVVTLIATGTNLLWYTTSIGGIGSTIAPTPNTNLAGVFNYYVSQTVTGCEGPRALITVVIISRPLAPTVTTPVIYCQNVTATALSATAQPGASLLWYTASTGGIGSNTAPVPSTIASGNTIYYVSQFSNINCEGPRSSITVTVTAAPAAPTVTTPITYCQNAAATALTATGTNLKWYTTATGGTASTVAPIPSTTTIGSTIYYVSQTVSTCESPRAAITVNISATTPAPTVTTPVTYCQNATTVPLTATGTGLLWYTSASGGTGSATAPTPSTTTAGSTTYYVSQTQTCGESPRAAITVTVNALPALPSVVTAITYCQNAPAPPLTATGTNLLWYTVATGGTGSTTAPTPSTINVGTLTYYVSQTVNGCEGPRAAIVVTVNAIPAAPVVSTPVTYCQNVPATVLTATGTNLLWYTSAIGGTGSSTSPIPSTTTVGSTIFYVSQTTNNCESPRAAITVNVVASTPAPTVTTPVTYCQNATTTPLTAIGTSLLWYTTATGGTGSTTAPTPSTTTVGNTTYYVSQTLSCGEGPRAAITVTINAIPGLPTVTTPVAYCQNATATALLATGTNLLWYSTPIGGGGVSATPTPSTTAVGSVTYYVSQTVNGCEGPRAAITVTVNVIPSAPIVSTPLTICQNTTATALTATGTNLLWYTSATGGTGSSTSPIPSTTTVGSTIFYVSQTTNNCESPRATITVNVVASTPAPTITTPITYCQNATATPLTATGTSLLWYTAATGGTGNATAPTPSTTTVGSTTYYVSQTLSCGEGPRAAITVTINPIPTAPTVTTPVAYCQNATATALVATGTNLLWYSTPTGGGGVSATPTPSTTAAGSVTYYVSQTVNGCVSARAAIVVTINAIPLAPTATTAVSYCQNTTVTALTATGTNLLWYTTATGGTGTATAPTPSTTTVGATTYYVSQSANTCEGPRTAITVTIVAATPAPTVTTPVTYCRNATATALTAIGTNLLWYTTATGGTGSTTAPIPNTTTVGSTIYYVSQTLSCGEGPRAAITVTINAVPNAPTVTSPIAYCQNTTAVPLTATGTSLLWYTAPTGGIGSATAPTPSTSTVGSVIYYVSQTVNGCESPLAAIVVNTNITPIAPTTSSTVNYCQNAAATALSATGANLIWYSVATGGTGSTTAPIPSTTTAGSTNYYVSQTVGICEGPRSTIVVTVTALPTAPTVTSPVTYCQNATATTLAATGTGLLWFTTAAGGTGSATAPTPATTTAGNTSYYVAQTNTCGEGPRVAIIVNVTATPAAPTALTTTNVTLNSATLNWTGAANNFYTVEYKLTTATTWTTAAAGIQATTYNLTGLTIGSEYQWRVSANCAATGVGNFATAPLFSTANRNNIITVVKDGIGLKISPNPVRTNAIIDYIVPGTGEVTFNIIDQYGRIIKTFSEGQKVAGQYQKDIVGEFSNMLKGAYFIRIQQNGKKIALHFIKY